MGISVKKFQKLKQKIDVLYRKGQIKTLNVSDIREYVDNSNGKANISSNELKSLEVCEKVKSACKSSISDMIEKDEQVREEQLKNGEITREEYDRLLIKNGVVTVGNRNFSKIYLNDLESVDRKHKELLPAPEKKMSIYKKLHALSPENVLEKFTLSGLNVGIALGALGIASSIAFSTALVPFIAIGGTCLVVKEGFKFKYKNKHKGIYTDAKRDQKILYSGITEYQDTISRDKQKELNKKLVYTRDKLIMPIKIEELTDEQQKNIVRIQEITGKETFDEKDKNKLIMGSKNWYMLFANSEKGISVEDVVMSGNNCLKKNNGKDSQEELLESLKQMILSAKKNNKEVSFNVENKRTKMFCERYEKNVLSQFERNMEEKIKNKKDINSEIEMSR